MPNEQEIYQKAVDHFKNAQFEQAVKLCKSGMLFYPASPFFFDLLGKIYYTQGEYEQIPEILFKALKLFNTPPLKLSFEDARNLHMLLMDSYYEIGLSSGFSEELNLRIFYHAEEYRKLIEGDKEKEQAVINFLDGIIATNKLDQTFPKIPEASPRSLSAFPEDGISHESKIANRKKLIAIMKRSDAESRDRHVQSISTEKCIDVDSILEIGEKLGDRALFAEWNYHENKREGIAKQYYESRNLFQEVNYKDGRQDGLAKAYYPDGTLKVESTFVEGKFEGLTKSYYESGEPKRVSLIKDNLLISEKEFNEVGEITSEQYTTKDPEEIRNGIEGFEKALQLFREESNLDKMSEEETLKESPHAR